MRILLTGRAGQVGWELERALQVIGDVNAFDRAGCDLTDPDALLAVLNETRPQLIVNAAAYTAVDKAESEPELAHLVNAKAPGRMASWAAQHQAVLIHFSTDYVFDGTLERPYLEGDATAPLSTYGQSKLAGEQAIQAAGCAYLILRTSWVYGSRGRNFLRTVLRLAEERDELRIVSDQHGAPTWSRSLADAVLAVVADAAASGRRDMYAALLQRSGVFHVTNGGCTSWHGFASAIMKHRDVDHRVSIIPITTEEYPTPARRPANSRMSNAKFESTWRLKLPHWESALALCLSEVSRGDQ